MAWRRNYRRYGLILALAAAACTDAGNGSVVYCETSDETSGFALELCGDNKHTGDVALTASSSATDIAGVTWIDGSLVIEDVGDAQGDLAALRDVRCVERDVIVRASNLTSLDALGALRRVGGSLIIGERAAGNESLASLSGLQSLTSVDGVLWIQQNPKLADVGALSNLAFVGDMLGVVDNDSLASIDAFAGLAHVGGFLNIVNNRSLPTCAAAALSDQLASECRNVCVRGNSQDSCPSDEELCWYQGVE